jgi:hypothetical protein
MAKKIKARVQKTKHVFVHNDLSQAALHHEDAIQEKLNNGKRNGIAYDGMACALMVAFAFEANVNFIGFKLHEAGKLPNWQEREKFDKKLNKVFKALSIPVEEDKRPTFVHEAYESAARHAGARQARLCRIRQGSGRHAGRNRPIHRAWNLRARGWETECTPDAVKEARGDLEELWKLMIEKSGLSLYDTMTGGDGAISFIEHVDASEPSTLPERIVDR